MGTNTHQAMSYVHSDGNQWEEVTFSKRPGQGQRQVADKGHRGETDGVAKFDKGASDKNRKLDESDEAQRIQKVDLNLRQAIQKARTAKGWSQKELATKLNEKPQVINEYESGKAVPNGQLLGKMDRILGVKLPRPPKKPKA